MKRISSDYRIDADGRLIVGNIPQTLVKTSGARLAQKRRIASALGATPTIGLSGGQLQVTPGDAVLRRNPPPSAVKTSKPNTSQ